MKWVLGLLIAFVAGFGLAAWIYKLAFLPWGLEYLYLVAAGGFGGAAQALVSGADRLRLPGQVTDSKGSQWWDAGFLADVFIGALGATVSLLFALALLSDRFFGAMGDKQPDVFVPTWVRIVAFGALTGFASRQLLPKLAAHMSNLIAKEVKKKVEPQVELARSQVELAQLSAAAVPSAAAQAAAAQAAAAGGPTPLALLRGLVQQYRDINIGPYDARVAARMGIADAMLPILVANGVTSANLADWITGGQVAEREFVLPLATLIAARPEAGDARRLFDAVDHLIGTPALKADSKFILYRALLAIVALKDNHHLPRGEFARAKALARACREIGDPSLRRKAEAVLTLLR